MNNFLKFKQVGNRYTPIVNGVLNDFIEVKYDKNCIYQITWLNKFEKLIIDRVHEKGLQGFVIMLHKKYYNLLKFKTI